MTRKTLTNLLICALLSTCLTGAATAANNDKKETKKQTKPTATRINFTNRSAAQPISGNPASSCIADCGDGTGWECTGSSVTCVDGAGCSASGGGVTLIGLC
jgi:hypothetical protein